jgi:hypothetical protein
MRMKNRILGAGLACTVSFTAALLLFPVSQQPAAGTVPALEDVAREHAVDHSYLDELRGSKLRERVAVIESDQKRQDAIIGKIDATIDRLQWIAIGMLVSLLLSLMLNYLKLQAVAEHVKPKEEKESV